MKDFDKRKYGKGNEGVTDEDVENYKRQDEMLADHNLVTAFLKKGDGMLVSKFGAELLVHIKRMQSPERGIKKGE